MITKLMREQLKNCSLIELEENKYAYFIKKTEIITPKVGKNYIVQVDKKLLKDKGDEVLQYNWNNGNFPKCEYYLIDVIRMVGKMMLCYCVEYNIEKEETGNDMFNGYLPKDRINVLKEI